MPLLFLFILFFSRPVLAGFEPAPTHEISCSADLFLENQKQPISGIAPVSFTLDSNQEIKSWKSVLQKIEINSKYKNSYSSFWIKPWSDLPLFAQKNILSMEDLKKNNISFQLSRFQQTEKRVAGISVEYNIENGYYGAFLIRPKIEGLTYTHISPIKNESENENLRLSLHCLLKDNRE